MSYQDVLDKQGQVIKSGERECAVRFEALRGLLNRYTRPFTVLDLGAAQGYFGLRIAASYPACAVMVDQDAGLIRSLARVEQPRTIGFRTRITAEDLQRLATCEHFDVVLCLNVLHHFAKWPAVLDAVFQLGDHVVIETPPPEERGACNQGAITPIYTALLQHRPHVLGYAPTHTGPEMRALWYFARPGRGLTRSYWDTPNGVSFGTCEIQSSFVAKRISMVRKKEARDWIPGINLRTYQRWGGAYPAPSAVARLIDAVPVPTVTHGDIRPWNFVFDGSRVTLIDWQDRKASGLDSQGLVSTAREIREMELTA